MVEMVMLVLVDSIWIVVADDVARLDEGKVEELIIEVVRTVEEIEDAGLGDKMWTLACLRY